MCSRPRRSWECVISFSPAQFQVLWKQSSPDADPCACVPYLPLDGDAPDNPCNSYALSKQVCEVMLRYFARAQMNCVAIRYPWLIDPAKHDFSKRKSGLVKKVHGVFSYLSFDDAAKLVVAILGAPLPDFRIYMPADPKKNRLGAEPQRKWSVNTILAFPCADLWTRLRA